MEASLVEDFHPFIEFLLISKGHLAMKKHDIIPNALVISKKTIKKLSPAQTILISFLLVIILGTLLLYLPISHLPNVNVSFLDALFTSTSAVCVTGLVTLATATTWSIFGKIIILCLIQIGGLSLITLFTYFAVHLGKKVTLKSRLTIQAAFNSSTLNGMVRMVIMVIKGTLICEGIGAIILFIYFSYNKLPWYLALFYGIFHSVSAFCNAGFDVLGEQSLTLYSSSFTINFVIMTLIIIGGIGFIVWSDVIRAIKSRLFSRTKRKIAFTLHTKLALLTTGILLIIGTSFFILNEYNNPATLGALNWPHKVLAAAFQSTTLRTAGFTTISQNGLKESSKLVSSIFMMIGGSPGGTAGGIKTVTIAIVFCSVWSVIKDYNKINVFGRTLSIHTLLKSLTIILLMLLLWGGSTILLSITEQNSVYPHTFIDLLYETSSALGTVGLTTGITPFLSNAGKILLMLCMFIGRIGPITLVVSLANRSNHNNTIIQYPTEDVMIG
jgi:trk system potassium uptake protein TrkH